jgi:hypothetical protein
VNLEQPQGTGDGSETPALLLSVLLSGCASPYLVLSWAIDKQFTFYPRAVGRQADIEFQARRQIARKLPRPFAKTPADRTIVPSLFGRRAERRRPRYGNLQLAPIRHIANEVGRTKNATIAAAGIIDEPTREKNRGETKTNRNDQIFQDKYPGISLAI